MGDLFYKTLPSQRDLGEKIEEREPNESLQRVGTVLNYNALQDMVVGLILMEKLLLLLHWRRVFFVCVSSRSGIKSACSSEGEDKEERGQKTRRWGF